MSSPGAGDDARRRAGGRQDAGSDQKMILTGERSSPTSKASQPTTKPVKAANAPALNQNENIKKVHVEGTSMS